MIRLLFRIIIWFVVISIAWVGIYRFVPPPVTFTMLGNALDGRGIHKDWMPLSKIDPDMARAAIAGEDARFCEHHGFDFIALQKAYRHNERGGRIRGGSTISQQTAKNAFLIQGGGYVRKAFEAWFTVLIEALWGKHRIMEVYLNVAETGIGTYGVNAGAQRYFHHDASHLTATEAARTVFHRTRFIDHDAAAAHGLAVHALDRRLSFGVAAHFHEPEAFGAARLAFHHHLGAGDLPELAERLLEIAVTHLVGQVAYVQFIAHLQGLLKKQ